MGSGAPFSRTAGSDFAGSPGIPTYRDLRSWNDSGTGLTPFVPERMQGYAVHADPEFETYTYGDVESARASCLRSVERGDQLWFLARLWGHDRASWTGESDFYFIGLFDIQENLSIPAGSRAGKLPEDLRWRIAGNAHYKRMFGAGEAGAFRVLIGNPRRSCRFQRALKVTPEVAGHLYGGAWDVAAGLYWNPAHEILRNRNGKSRHFETFGSATRSIQAFLNSDDASHHEHIRALRGLAEHHASTNLHVAPR